jgi:hypothetical protein
LAQKSIIGASAAAAGVMEKEKETAMARNEAINSLTLTDSEPTSKFKPINV